MTARRVLGPLALALAARLPAPAIGLVLLLWARELGCSYAVGGLATGAFALGMAAGAPLLGRFADRHGLAPMLRLSGGAAAVLLCTLTQLPAGAPLLLVALAMLCGLTMPPITASLRGIWSRTLAPHERVRAFAFEASLQELVFMFGPLLLVSLATRAGPAVAFVVAGLMLATFNMAFSFLPEARAAQGAPTARARTSPLADTAVRVLVVLGFAMGVAFGATDVGILASAERHHAEGIAGLLYGAWGCGSLPAGLAWARHGGAGDAIRHMQLLLLALATFSMLLIALGTTTLLAIGLVLAGAAVAPTLAVMASVISDVAPPETLTETYAWQTTGTTCGTALGSAAAGAIGALLGAPAIFGLAGLALLAGLAVLVRRGPLLRNVLRRTA